MKKIFLFLFLVYSYSFAESCDPGYYSSGITTSTASKPAGSAHGWQKMMTNGIQYIVKREQGSYSHYQGGIVYYYYTTYSSECSKIQQPNIPFQPTGNELCKITDGKLICSPNPQENGQPRCDDLFVKDGQAYTCNPNTNEASPIPNSNGLAYDPESDDYVPNCNDGYDSTSTPTLVVGGSGSNYTTWGCAPSTGTGDTGTGSTGDGSDTGGDTGVGGSTGTGTGDTGSTGESGSTTGTGNSGSTTGTGDNSSTGGSGGSVSGGDGTGGTGDTGTDNSDTGDNTDTTTPPTEGSTDGTGGTGDTGTDNSDTGDNTDTTTPPTDGSTDGTGDNTDTTNGADSCDDPNLTLQEKMLCQLNNAFSNLGLKIDSTNRKIDSTNTKLNNINTSLGSIKEQFTPKEEINTNPLNGSSSLINSVINEYSTFKSNITNQGETLKTLVNSSIDTVNNGFEFNITSNEVLNCPKTYELNLSALNMQNMDVILDICEQSSKLKPYFYPLFLILFSIATTIITFRMLGVLI